MNTAKNTNINWKMPKQHPDAKNPNRILVRFYNDTTLVNKLNHGYQHFEVGRIGWKWVKIRPEYLSSYRENYWTRIKKSKWDEIRNLKSFTILQGELND